MVTYLRYTVCQFFTLWCRKPHCRIEFVITTLIIKKSTLSICNLQNSLLVYL